MAQRKAREPDPDTQIAGLERALSAGPLPRAILLRGDERWFREEALRVALEAARKAGMEVARHDTSDPDFDLRGLCDDLRAAPMFASARCVVLRNAAALLKKDEGEHPPVTRALLAFLADESSPGAAVVDAEGLRADHALVKATLARGGAVLNLRRLWDSPPPWAPDPRKSELVLWLQARARARRIALTPDEALYVATATGNDLFALDAALERLRTRDGGAARGGAAGRAAERGSTVRGGADMRVREAVGWSSGGSPFDLAEHLLRGDAPQSVAGIEALFALGFQGRDGEREVDRTALLAITLGALRSKLRQTLHASLAIESGSSVEDALRASGAPAFPKARDEMAARIRLREPRAWRAMVDDLAEVERRTRRGALVDASDLVALALRWRRRETAGSARRA